MFAQTYSGKIVYPLNPTFEVVCLEDIAHHLASIPRFGGAAKFHYSVAQHCVLMCELSRLCGHSDPIQKQMLMHDAPEYIVGDMISPVIAAHRDLIGGGKTTHEYLHDRWWSVIAAKFSIEKELHSIVKEFDRRILMNEKARLFKHDVDWLWYTQPLPFIHISETPVNVTKRTFVYHANRLGIKG